MANKNTVILILALLFSTSLSITMITSRLSSVYAKGETITEPLWYEAGVKLIEPACVKTGAPGLLRFYIKPIIEGDFEFKVRFSVNSDLIDSKDSAVKVIKASKNRPLSADFEFKAKGPVNELFTVEFSAAYPSAALIKLLEIKYGRQLSEVKNLAKKIKSRPGIYSASLPVKLIITDVECALNPEIYFEKNPADSFFNIVPSINNEDAIKKIDSFRAKYEGIFELSGSAFDRFIRRTGCNFSDDLNDYFKGLHAFYYLKFLNAARVSKDFESVIENIPDESKVFEFAAIYDKYLKDNETKKHSSEYSIVDNRGDAAGKISVYIAAFYNLYYTEKFKNATGNKKKSAEIIKNYESVIKLLITGDFYADKVVNNPLAGYFNYNLAMMYKKSGAVDYKRYFEMAKSKNKGLIID